MEQNNNSIYTQEELDILKLTREKRLTIVNDMTRNGTPPKAGEVEVLNQVLTSLDKSVHDTVSNRLKHQENNNKAEIMLSVAEAIKQVKANNKNNIRGNDEILDLEATMIPTDIVEDEDSMLHKQYTLDEIMKEEDI